MFVLTINENTAGTTQKLLPRSKGVSLLMDIEFPMHLRVVLIKPNRPLSRRLDRCVRVIQNESGDSKGGNV